MKYARDIYIQNTLAILVLVFIFHSLVLQQTFLASDYLPTIYWIYNFYTNLNYFNSSLAWDGFTSMGTPLYVNPLGLYYSPLNYFLSIFSITKISFSNFYILMQYYLIFILICCFFSYKYFLKKSILFRDINNDKHLILAFSFVCSTYFINQINTIYPIYCAFFMPPLLVYVEKVFMKSNFRNSIIFSLLLSAIILSGGIELITYCFILLTIYIFFLIFHFRKKIIFEKKKIIKLISYLFFILINVSLICSIYYYPIYNFSEYTSRGVVNYDIYPKYQYKDLISIFFRNIINQPQFVWYCGGLFSSLIIINLIYVKKIFVKYKVKIYFLCLIFFTGIIFSLGSKTFLFYFIYKFIPLVDSFNGPYKFNFMLTLILPLIIGYLIQNIDLSKKTLKTSKFKIMIIIFFLLIILLYFTFSKGWGLKTKLDRFEIYVIQLVIIFLFSYVIYLYNLKRFLSKRKFSILIILLIAFDARITFINTPQTTKTSPESMFDHNDIIKKIKELNNTGELNKNRVIYYKYPTPLHYANEYSGIPNIFGYNVVEIYSDRHKFYNNLSVLGFLNTKYIVTEEKLELKKILETKDYRDKTIYLYENKNFNNLFYINNNGFIFLNEEDCLKYIAQQINNNSKIKVCISHDQKFNFNDKKYEILKNSKIEILNIEDHQLNIRIQNNKESFIVWNENYHKYWNLKVNNLDKKIFKVNGTLSGFELDKGINDINLTYKQADVRLLSKLFFFMILINFLSLFFERRLVKKDFFFKK